MSQTVENIEYHLTQNIQITQSHYVKLTFADILKIQHKILTRIRVIVSCGLIQIYNVFLLYLRLIIMLLWNYRYVL